MHTFFVARFALGLAGSFGAAAAFLGLPFALGASSAASSSVASAFFAAAFFALGLGASSSGSESSPAETSLMALVKSSPPESDSAACAGEPEGQERTTHTDLLGGALLGCGLLSRGLLGLFLIIIFSNSLLKSESG